MCNERVARTTVVVVVVAAKMAVQAQAPSPTVGGVNAVFAAQRSDWRHFARTRSEQEELASSGGRLAVQLQL